MEDEEPPGYSGPAVVTVAAHSPVTVQVELSGNFDPLAGRFRWHGRIRGLTAELAPAAAPARGDQLGIRTPFGFATATVTHIDLWGSHMVDGESDPPFAAMQSDN